MGISLQKLFSQKSGHFGHKGRPGAVGGSVPDDLPSQEKILSEAERDYYWEKKRGTWVESPSKDFRDLKREDLLKMNPEELVTVKFYSGGRGGVSRKQVKVKQLLLSNEPKISSLPTMSKTYPTMDSLISGLRSGKRDAEVSVTSLIDQVISGSRFMASSGKLDKSKVKEINSLLRSLPDPISSLGGQSSTNELLIQRLEIAGKIYDIINVKKNQLFHSGGVGSGFHGHKGRIGKVGGSTLSGGSKSFYRKVNKAAPNNKGYGSFLVDKKGTVYQTDRTHDDAAIELGYEDSDDFIERGSGIRIAYSRDSSGQQETNFQTKDVNTRTLEKLQALWAEDKVSVIDGIVVWASGPSSDVHSAFISTDDFLSASRVSIRDRRTVLNSLSKLFIHGGPGSGFAGHRGRPGEVGGSSKGEQRLKDLPAAKDKLWFDGKWGDEVSLKEVGFITEKPQIFGSLPSSNSPKYVEMDLQPSQLHVAQTTVTKDLVGKKMRGEWDDLELPVVVKEKGEYYIMSGNHMALAQYLRDGKVTAKVIEYVETGPRKGKYIKPGTFSNSLFFTQGGKGSGFHGHHGRPGMVGGSSKDGGAVLGIDPDKLQKMKERFQESINEPKEKREERHRKRVEDIVKRLGYPPEKVDARLEEGYAFEVDGKTYRAGGEFNPQTGMITMYDIDKRTDEQLEGMLAHEVQHSRWKAYHDAYQQQFIEVRKSLNSNDESDWLIRADGSLKNKSDRNRLWAYDIQQEFIQMGPRWDRLKKTDGISAYSKSYWKQANASGSSFDYDRAVDETLAEIARIKVGHARVGDKKGIRPIWQSLFNKVHRGTSVTRNQLLFLFGAEHG